MSYTDPNQDVKYTKSSTAPRRFKSAYIFFSMEYHKIIRALPGNAKLATPEVSRLVSQEWNKLDSKQKAKYHKMAELDRERYVREKSEYNGPWKVRVLKTKVDKDGAPKQPVSPFVLYMNTVRSQASKNHPDLSNDDLTRRIASNWRESSPSEQQPYLQEAARRREQYKLDLEQWQRSYSVKQTSKTAASLDELGYSKKAASPVQLNNMKRKSENFNKKDNYIHTFAQAPLTDHQTELQLFEDKSALLPSQYTTGKPVEMLTLRRALSVPIDGQQDAATWSLPIAKRPYLERVRSDTRVQNRFSTIPKAYRADNMSPIEWESLLDTNTSTSTFDEEKLSLQSGFRQKSLPGSMQQQLSDLAQYQHDFAEYQSNQARYQNDEVCSNISNQEQDELPFDDTPMELMREMGLPNMDDTTPIDDESFHWS